MKDNYIEDLNTDDIGSQSTDSLLESLSLEIMETSIMDQIVGNHNTNRDFLDIVLSKFRAIIENSEVDTDSIRGISSEMIDWADRLVKAIVAEFNLGYNNPGEETLDILDILESLYHFFILDRGEHTRTFFINYIEINKSHIIEQLGIGGRCSDITSLAYKEKNIDKNNIAILSNLQEVIQYIANSSGADFNDFLQLVDEGDVYTANVQYYFDTYMLCGDFFRDYIKYDVGNYTDDISTELRSEIRVSLIN